MYTFSHYYWFSEHINPEISVQRRPRFQFDMAKQGRQKRGGRGGQGRLTLEGEEGMVLDTSCIHEPKIGWKFSTFCAETLSTAACPSPSD